MKTGNRRTVIHACNYIYVYCFTLMYNSLFSKADIKEKVGLLRV